MQEGCADPPGSKNFQEHATRHGNDFADYNRHRAYTSHLRSQSGLSPQVTQAQRANARQLLCLAREKGSSFGPAPSTWVKLLNSTWQTCSAHILG